MGSMKPHRWFFAAGVASTLLLAALAACALFEPPPIRRGSNEAELSQLLGAPTGRYPMPAGVTRLEFARGPFGRQTWMVDLDAGGHVTDWWQALEEWRLHAFQADGPGMTRDQLLRTLGRPAERRHGGRMGGELWSWRYPTNDCLWYQVSLDDDARVTSAGFNIDPMCDANDRSDTR